MSTKEIAYKRHIGPEDVLDVQLRTRNGRILAFTLNHRTSIKGRWIQVIRYDTHHGRLHVHRFWRKEKDQVEILEKDPIQDYTVQFQKAEKDILRNRVRYRSLIEEKGS